MNPAPPDFDDIEFSLADGVASILLDRPASLNASTSRMMVSLLAALEHAAADDAVRVVVLAGKGRAFCAGADLKEDVPEGTERQLLEKYLPVMQRIASMKVPVIAAVAGSAVGVGMSLALCCDLIVMAEDAHLWAPFTRIGLVPDGGASWLLVRQLGYQRAFEVIAGGVPLGAQAAFDLGLVNRISPPGEHLSMAVAWGREIATGSAHALAGSKQLMRLAMSATFGEVFRAEARAQALCSKGEFFQRARRDILARKQAKDHHG